MIWNSQRHRLGSLIIALNLIDVILTAICIYALGFIELNPFANMMPLWMFMIIKMAAVICVVAVMEKRTIHLWVYRAMLYFMGLVVVWSSLNIAVELIV